MKKFSKYITIFFGFYNLFLVAVAAFDLFSFSSISLRILLGLEALQVAIYKLCEAFEEDTTVSCCDPESTLPAAEPTIKIVKANAPIIKLRHAVRNHIYEYREYRQEIQENIAHDLGEEILKNGAIKFSEQKDYDGEYITTIAEVDVVKY